MNVEKLYRVAKIKRGRSTTSEEKVEVKNNDKIVEAYILSYSDVSSNLEDILLENTIIEGRELDKVFIDLYGKYKNVRVESDTIILPVNHNNKVPKLVTFKDKEKFKNLIIADEIICITPDKNYVNPKYLFYIISTPKIINRLNNYENNDEDKKKKKLTCSEVESLTFNLPSMEKQLEIVKELDLINSKKVELEKQAKKILTNLT